MLFASHETTSHAILMLFLTLRQNPEAYERLQQEQNEASLICSVCPITLCLMCSPSEHAFLILKTLTTIED